MIIASSGKMKNRLNAKILSTCNRLMKNGSFHGISRDFVFMFEMFVFKFDEKKTKTREMLSCTKANSKASDISKSSLTAS